MLYCNARSQEEGLQQVHIIKDASGNALNGDAVNGRLLDRQYITGNIGAAPQLADGLTLTIRYDNYGYRLPSTSEWMFAAALYADQYAKPGFFFPQNEHRGLPEDRFTVFQDGSRSRASRAAGKIPTNFGLFDVLGNAAELVQDFNRATGVITQISAKGEAGISRPGILITRNRCPPVSPVRKPDSGLSCPRSGAMQPDCPDRKKNVF